MAEPVAEANIPQAERVIPVHADSQSYPSHPPQQQTTSASLSTLGIKASSSSDIDILKVFKDVYHPTRNASGYVNLGVAENSLMHDTLTTYINTPNPPDTDVTSEMLTYGDGGMGSTRLRTTIARFLTRNLHPLKPIEADHVIVTNGCSSAIEQCAFLLSEPGECWLLGQPYYGTFPLDLTFRPGAAVLPVSFNDIDPLSPAAAARYEETLLKAQSEGKKVKGLILCHPHNPLGRCYPLSTIESLMRLCGKYNLHFISDEIYALSVWSNNEDTSPDTPEIHPFTSTATIDTSALGLPPSNHHILWALSKDFGANGLRIGVVISQRNTPFIRALTLVSFYSYISSLADTLACRILSDDAFTDAYIAENQTKLSQAYTRTCQLIRSKGIHHEKGANAAFFLWLDLGAYFTARHPHWKAEYDAKVAAECGAEGDKRGEAEGHDLTTAIMEALMTARVFLASGTAFGSERAGWFRLVFSQDEGIVDEGVKRIVEALS